ncbi:SURF1 family protein [Ancylobacter terrae]|uniref:SURF1 family protein n=1 Tax=Ancylobacter sp. sgz301288 TaxID=3342077 RepID=UPI00385FB98B
MLVPTIAMLVALVILLGLGTWQLERLNWKNDLIARVEERVAEPAEPAPAEGDWESVSYDRDEYRHVTAAGRFRHDLEVQVYALLDTDTGAVGGPGYWILTPLVAADGSAILVNRGFVPRDRRAPATRAEGQVDGAVTVTGLLRMPEQPTLFTPDNDPASEGWYVRDPMAIASARGIARVAPFMIDADATPNPGGLPIGGRTRITFPNRHLEYALTWYGLAATLLGVYAAYGWSRRRKPATR